MNPVTMSIDEGTTNGNSDKKKSKYETRTEGDNSCLQSKFLTLHQKLIGVQALFSYQNPRELLNRVDLISDVVLPYNKISFSARDMVSFFF